MKLDRSIVRNVFTASSLAVLAMLSGCGTTGQQVESEVAEAVAQQINDVPEAFGEAAAQAAAIPVGWVDEFHDDTLKALVLEAQANNKNLAAAAANVNRAQALAAQAGSELSLHRHYRTILSQLRSGHCPILQSYLHSINAALNLSSSTGPRR